MIRVGLVVGNPSCPRLSVTYGSHRSPAEVWAGQQQKLHKLAMHAVLFAAQSALESSASIRDAISTANDVAVFSRQSNKL